MMGKNKEEFIYGLARKMRTGFVYNWPAGVETAHFPSLCMCYV
jgi:hypothetical protein